MKKIYKFGSLVTTGAIFLSTLASSAFATSHTGGASAVGGNAGTVQLCPTTANAVSASLCSLNLTTALPNILNMLLFVAFIAALVFLIYGGIRWILSGGDKEGTAKAKGTVTAALIGLAIVLASWLIVNIVLGFFGLTVGGVTVIPKIF